jgi:hypothetical protein
MTTMNVQRPYVGQNALDITQVKDVSDKKAGDVTSPPKPQVLRAWAFELAADGTSVVPPPPPPQPGVPPVRRDPLVIELGNMEIGVRVELISLSDNPAAKFDATHKAEIFELPMTGYDVAGRTATIALNEEQMKEKNIVAGERFMLRQVDKDGNASEPVFVHLDPSGWATSQLDEPLQDGTTQRVSGAHINISTGLTGLNGNPNQGKMERVLGKSTVDEHKPVLLEKNVSVVRGELSQKDLETGQALARLGHNVFGGLNWTHADVDSNINHPSNIQAYATNPTYAADWKLVTALAKDAKAFERLAAFTHESIGSTPNGSLNWSGLHDMHNRTSANFAAIRFDHALEPGVSITVQNSRTSERGTTSLGNEARTASIIMRDVKHGDPLIVEFADAHNNHGDAYAFQYDEKAKDGKMPKANPLSIRFANLDLLPKPPKNQN